MLVAVALIHCMIASAAAGMQATVMTWAAVSLADRDAASLCGQMIPVPSQWGHSRTTLAHCMLEA